MHSSDYRRLYLDFEFSNIVESKVGLVCCCTYDPVKKHSRKWWLHKDEVTQGALSAYLCRFNYIIGYSVIAECRSFIALGLDPLDWNWEDQFLEYRLITNHNDKMQWGKQLVEGRVKPTRKPKPKWERTDEDKATGFRATHSLAEATYKLTGEIRDTKEKTDMRNLIISYPPKFTAQEKHDILNYCMEDVVFLPRIGKAITTEFKRLCEQSRVPFIPSEYRSEKIGRGRYAAHTAWMENNGYPLSLEATKNFSKQVSSILFDVQREINGLFPDIKPFKFQPKVCAYSWKQKETREWIAQNHDVKSWPKTDGGAISLSLDAFEKQYAFRHDYPTDNLGAQFVRYLKLKQSLYGFTTPKNPGGAKYKKKKSFWDSVGTDGRVRPYMNIFGAQSSRSQPGATGFMFLKPAWMRALVQPNPGKFMAGIDYGSQEYFIAALQCNDRNMIDSYLSGDVYLAFGKLSGQIPKNGTKESHKAMRDLCKSTVLGISYLMTKFGLAIKLTNDSGREWTEDEAQEQIDAFYEAYELLGDAQKQLMREYQGGDSYIKLPCGWYMWGDNENVRSVVNVPIQGMGASIMRKAVDLYHAKTKKHVVFTLHDALYIEGDVGDEHLIVALRDSMREAFQFYSPKKQKTAGKIKLDPFAWSPDYKKDSEIKLKNWVIPVSNLYIDERAQKDYDKFSWYFDAPETDLL